jgi:uncharacterized protein YukE
MAIEKTRANIPAMEQAIKTYEAKRDAMQLAYLKISEAITHDVQWKGSSGDKFRDQFNQLYQNLRQTETQMDSAIAKMQQAINIYSETEEAAQQIMNSIEEGAAPTFF